MPDRELGSIYDQGDIQLRQPTSQPDVECGVTNQRTISHCGASAEDHENASREAAVSPELPLVSIITPCQNAAGFIEQCIESVLAQSHARVEHIIQDGASVDGTVAILERYTGQIDWVSEPDRGQADALDKALKRSRGNILLILNADDMLMPDAASWAAVVMARCPSEAVIYGDLYLMDEVGNVTGEFIAPEYDFPSVLCVEKVLPAQAAFIRRSALEQVGLGTDSTLDTCPDYEMFVRLGLRFAMRHVRGFVTKYRYHVQPTDGRSPRTVDRFVRAKSLVMERVFCDPAVPERVKALRKRAQTGLLLWASTEARRMGDSCTAVKYFAEALAHFGVTGRLLAAGLRRYLKNWDERVLYRAKPSLSRTLALGRGLASELPHVAQIMRLIRVATPALGKLPYVVLLAVMFYFLLIMSRMVR